MADVDRLRQLRLANILSQIGAASNNPMTIDSFNSRLQIQKSIYLLKKLSPGLPLEEYRFTSYLRGPYCPSLAVDYYAVFEKKLPSNSCRIGIKESDLRTVAEAVSRGVNFLEAVATLHSILDANPNCGQEAAIAHARYLKPHLNFYLGEAWQFLQRKHLIPQ